MKKERCKEYHIKEFCHCDIEEAGRERVLVVYNDMVKQIEKEAEQRCKDNLYKLLASMESCEDARECRHLLKELILNQA